MILNNAIGMRELDNAELDIVSGGDCTCGAGSDCTSGSAIETPAGQIGVTVNCSGQVVAYQRWN